jgi:hypothetical protein
MPLLRAAQRSVASCALVRSASVFSRCGHFAALLLLLSGGSAAAACAIPNQLTNGQIADAIQVMSNLSAVANCASALVPLGNGQVVVGATGAPPQATTLSAGPGITITNGPGSITISSSTSGGAGAPVMPPQGRLTLTTNAPVMTADTTAATTIYYTPYQGNWLPIAGVMYSFGNLSYALSTAAHQSGSLYDVFAYLASGPSVALCTGPAWTSTTIRSAAIGMTNGVLTNSATLTCTLSGGGSTTPLSAGDATYLGTFYATGNGQTGMAFRPAAVSGGSAPVLGLWNAYNRVSVSVLERDSNPSNWTVSSTSWVPFDSGVSGGLNNRITYVDGQGQSSSFVSAQAYSRSNTTNSSVYLGITLNSTSAAPDCQSLVGGVGGIYVSETVTCGFAPSLGLNYLQLMERVDSGTASHWPANNSSFNARLEM